MSFTIILQKNSSPLNKADKSLSTIATLNGTLRNETEIVHPVILIEYSGFPDCNYVTIPEFKRSYFIEDPRSVRNNIWEIQAHSDPLTSFISEIRSNSALILRQENNFDLYLNDGVFKCKQNSRVEYQAFPNGFDNFNYILLAAGGASQSGS